MIQKNMKERGSLYCAPCFGIPSVISTVFLRHATQRLAELGTIGVPQSAQRTLWMAGPGTNSILEWFLGPCAEYLGMDCGSEEVAARLYIFPSFC